MCNEYEEYEDYEEFLLITDKWESKEIMDDEPNNIEHIHDDELYGIIDMDSRLYDESTSKQ